ncbi:MAG: hypothetical protein ABMB14_37915, partial [Myxococcota bacterium]
GLRQLGWLGWLGWLGCAEPAGGSCPGGGPHLVLTTTDLESGAVATVDPATGCVADALASAGTDAIVRSGPYGVVIANRSSGDAIRRYAPGDYRVPVDEFVVERGGNVHDAVERDGDWWFTLYERDYVAVTGPDGAERDRISLADHADADGLPEADRLIERAGGLFVGVQRLARADGFAPLDGRIVALDPPGGWWAVGPDPKLYPYPGDDEQIVALTGRFFEPDGALVVFDPATGGSTTVATEAALGVDLDGFAGVGDRGVVLGVGFAVGDPSWIGCVDLVTGAVTDGITTDGWAFDAVAGDGLVYVAVRTGWGGSDRAVWSVDPATCAVEVLADGFALDPYGIAWVD